MKTIANCNLPALLTIMNTNQIEHLIALLDDTDEEVYESIKKALIDTGSLALPELYMLSLDVNTPKMVNDRIIEIISIIESKPIFEAFELWKQKDKPDLFEAMLLLNSLIDGSGYQPQLIKAEFDELQKIIWVETNNYLTPLEKIRIISHVIFKIKKITAQVVDFNKPEEFLAESVLRFQKGNNFSVSLLYMALCQIFDIKVHAIKFPKHIILCYFDATQLTKPLHENNFYNIQYFIDPSFGNILTHENISTYFSRIGMEPSEAYFQFLSNQELVSYCIAKLATAYDSEQKGMLKQLAQKLVG